MDLTLLLDKVSDIARDAGAYIREQRKYLQGSDIFAKGTHDYVTRVDKESEKKLVNDLGALVPDSGFLTEEKTTTQKQAAYTWIIDPLDGTTNFMHGSPPFAVSIALAENNKIVLGVVYEITMDELFTATVNDPARRNGEIIHVTETFSLKDALIATGFPFINYERLDPYMEVLKEYMVSSQGVRRLGSAATDLCWVACGRYDAFYEYNLSPWDVAAGTLILTKAGGKVTDFSGQDNYLYGKELVATNGSLHEAFIAPIHQYLTRK